MPPVKKADTTAAPAVATPAAAATKPKKADTPVATAATTAATPKKTAASKAGAPVAATTTASTAAAATTSAAAAATVAPVDQAAGSASAVGDKLISTLLENFAALSTQIKTMQSSLKVLAKEFDKQKKIIDKVQKKKEKAKKSPSGFAKPCKISDELCEFIGIAKGTEQSRTDITRFINSYVKQHNLNNPQNRREFFPDKKLKAILNVKDGDKVTYFVLQRLIAHHFPPSMSKLAAAAKAQ